MGGCGCVQLSVGMSGWVACVGVSECWWLCARVCLCACVCVNACVRACACVCVHV